MSGALAILPPPVSNSVIELLEAIGYELTAREWAYLLEVPSEQIAGTLAWLDARRPRREELAAK